MKRILIITVILYALSFMHGMLKAQMKSSASINVAFAQEASQSNFSETNKEQQNFQFFEVNAPETNEYYAEFWLLPARYADGTYTKFSVYVNDQPIGTISPNRDNWQAVRMEGNKKIHLQKGDNIIKVAVPAPEVPAIEIIQIALSDSEASISTSQYQEFCKKASTGFSYDIPKEESSLFYTQSDQASNTQDFSAKHFADVPLLYTFYKEFTFSKGDTISILTSSLEEHDVDVMYLGENRNHLIRDSMSTNNSFHQLDVNENNNIRNSETISSIPIYPGIINKPMTTYILGTSEELQGMNWKGLSRKDSQSDLNIISKFLKIPQKGVYLIRLRHRMPGCTGTASISVNGKYSYTDVPISFSWIQCEIPANDIEYGTMTFCDNPQKDDPILFIHGADADRIVGFNDDCSSYMRTLHELSYTDSHIMQKYKVKTTGISVSNYKSSNPESYCSIIAGLDESLFEPDPGLQSMPKYQKENGLQLFTPLKDLKISGSLEYCDVLKVDSQSTIRKVTVSDLSGNIIKSFKGEGTIMKIPGSLMNITKPGIYVVSVETEKGIISKKYIAE